ncbi:MAG: sialate O-acetylesterase [Luteolibacter sp.]
MKIPSFRPTLILTCSFAAMTLSWLACDARGQATSEVLPFLHPLFSENAVLQRDRTVPVWGWTQPRGKVAVEFDGKKQVVVADDKGRWTISLGAHAAGGPHKLSVIGTGKGESETRTNLLFGDVWLCSGQSNMAYDLKGVNNYKEEIATADYPLIRLLNIGDAIQPSPAQSFQNAIWQVCSPQTVSGFSGTGYFFGRKLYQELKVPIGLINSSWSGTPGESWVSEQALLAALPEFKKPVEEMKQKGDVREVYQIEMCDWWLKNDPGTAAHQEAPGFNDSTWKSMTLPGVWESKGFADFDGVMWFRRSIDIPADWAGKPLRLALGSIDDNDTTYWNGTAVGASEGFQKSRNYTVPAELVKAGRNVIAVRVVDISGGGGISGPAMSLKSESREVSLEGEWKVNQGSAYQALPPVPKLQTNPNGPVGLFNGKIAPLLPGAIKGVIWYQGESNADNDAEAQQYRTLLPTLVTDWRAHFGKHLPFYIMQLANFKAPDDTPSDKPWPNLREAQLQTAQRLPNTYLTVITDLGEENNIHFRNKQAAGARMAITALGTTYGRSIESSGPTLKSSRVVDGGIEMTFDHAQDLHLKGDQERVFAVACKDGKFEWAKPEITGNKLTVRSSAVPEPVRARFGWSNNPRASLYNSAELPASPFQIPPTEK